VAAFIAAQRANHGIPYAVSCRALGVSEGWFYKWKDGDRSPRRARRERLKAEIRRLFAAHKGKRGSPMITADLHDLGWQVGKNTVAVLMAEMGLAARPKKRRKGTTRPGKGRWRAPDLVKRDFPAAGINQKWYGDGTDEGKLYLDSVLDVGSRRVLGFALGERHEGPALGRPLVDRIRGSRIHHLKELRPGSAGRSEIRVLFAFDPTRSALLLLGGDKAGNWQRWYRQNIPIAEQLYLEYTSEEQE
jgi:putative transposase